MRNATKIWLWMALILGVATSALNASYGRWESVAIAAAALAGLCVLLFRQKKWGFYWLCGCYILFFLNGVYQGAAGGTGILASLGMSFLGSAFTPVVTYPFLQRDWKNLK